MIARRPDGGALVWTRRYGRGRVFYDALGHFGATWRDARQRRLMADGLRWATRRGRAAGARAGVSVAGGHGSTRPSSTGKGERPSR